MSGFTRATGRAVALAAVVGLFAAGGSAATPAAGGKNPHPRDPAKAFIHPVPLTATDTLTDGDGGEPIAITGPTTLVWVDLYPRARYSHPVQYILISEKGTRVVEGGWWPVLNGKPLFRDAATPSAGK